jgi:hypothetical protein
MIDVSVIIVTWNSSGEIKACADSVINNTKDLSVELIIIDNNSTDDSFTKANQISHYNIQTYQNADNLGYTKAVNQGIKYSSGNCVFLLNPDTVLGKNVIDNMYGFLQSNNDYAACAPLMLNTDGTVQQSVRNFPGYWKMFCQFSLLAYIFPKSKLFGSWKMKYFEYKNDADLNQPMAAAFMVKRDTLEKIGAMDERFEMFFNDTDLCKRIIESGKKIRLLIGTKVTHEHGTSVNKDRVKMIKTWNRDCISYFEKFHKNFIMLLWLKINLKISEIIRIAYYKITN